MAQRRPHRARCPGCGTYHRYGWSIENGRCIRCDMRDAVSFLSAREAERKAAAEAEAEAEAARRREALERGERVHQAPARSWLARFHDRASAAMWGEP